MPWSVAGNIRGPQGVQGNPGTNGVSVASAAKDGSGNLILTLSNGSTINAGNVVGPRGADGTSVTIVGSVATAASLPTGLTVQDAGDGYITNNDGHLHVWSGTAFTDVGVVRGPQGVKGDTGNTGVRGSNWYIGAGVPNGTNTVGSIPGDKYLDINSGDVYNLS